MNQLPFGEDPIDRWAIKQDWIDRIPNEDDMNRRGFGFFSSRRLESGDPGRLPESYGCTGNQSEWDDGNSAVSVPVTQEGRPSPFCLDQGERIASPLAVRQVVHLANGDELDWNETW